MLKVPKEQIGDDLPLFGPKASALDLNDALELVVGLEKTFSMSMPNSDPPARRSPGKFHTTTSSPSAEAGR